MISVNSNENVCGFYTMYIVFFAIFFIMSIGIISAFIYFHWHLKKVLQQQFTKHINGRFSKN